MAEYDPSHQTITWDEENEQGYEEGDDIETSQIEHSSDEQENQPYDLDSSAHALGDLPSRDGATDEVGAYDPDSVTSSLVPVVVPHPALEAAAAATAVSQAPVKPSSQPAPKKPRTAGGFLVGDSDSEDDEDEAPQVGASSEQDHQNSSSSSILVKSAVVQESAGVPSNPSPAPQVTAVVAALDNTSNAAPSAAAAARPVAESHQPAVNRIADLEKRVLDDPRGALDAWQALIAEHKGNNDIAEIRKTFDRVLAIFPLAADIWVEYLQFELSMNNFAEAEVIFGRSLKNVPDINLWTKYLDYIRRRNDLNDPSGKPRNIVASAYDFVIDNIGLDKDSGKIWAEYIQFLKSGPGTVGGGQWQDQQKMDQLRKAYQRAIVVPIANVNTLWKEYGEWEMALNKLTGRKYLTDKSTSYMSAKSANTALENITRKLNRATLPRLPPVVGFDGYHEYMEQVEIWKKWIEWEKSDPLDLKDDTNPNGPYQKRILYVYRQALMALWFCPEMWVDAAQWCLDNNISTPEGQPQGLEFITKGIEANPESVLLALKHADYIESTYPSDEKDEAKVARGKAVRAPYDHVLEALYEHINRIKDREATAIRNIQESAPKPNPEDAGDDEENRAANDNTQDLLNRIQDGYAAQTNLLKQIISFVWIALIRAMRRIQGKGKPNTDLGGMRQAFQEARQRGHLTSAVYSAVALMEWVIYKEPAGGKIFDRGAKLFPQDEIFALENIKYLHSRDDYNNARVLFETVVGKLAAKPETVHKAKPLYAYMHKYESTYGELAQIAKLEKRMAELFPEDRYLTHFSARYSNNNFNPISAQIIVSPATQTRPTFHPQMIMPSIEQQGQQHSPRPGQALPTRNSPPHMQNQSYHVHSPKRALQVDDYEESNYPPRKIQRNDNYSIGNTSSGQGEFQRGASPLKGAAGRRLAQQRPNAAAGASSYKTAGGPPPPLAGDIRYMLNLIPNSQVFDGPRLSTSGMLKLLQETYVPDWEKWRVSHGGKGHLRKVSTGGDFQQQQYGRSPSPYAGGGMRGGASQVAYRQASARPGSSGSYEPPPAFGGQFPPPGVNVGGGGYDGGQGGGVAAGGWPGYAPSGGGGYPPPPGQGYGQQGGNGNGGYGQQGRYPY
ncbi:hypothetical protein QBC43DRAFT_286476 [Cladorrhinum sp. PSN259]|nr:hypothetical protein QBC43DRAFT_286476 [Cladorrhinum sp. PSN259]